MAPSDGYVVNQYGVNSSFCIFLIGLKGVRGHVVSPGEHLVNHNLEQVEPSEEYVFS